MKQYDFYLIRGLGREGEHWGEFIDKLADQDFVNRVQTLDLPGSGKFNKISSPLQIGEYAEFLLTQIKPSNHPSVILSISLGSMVSIEMVRRSPELFSHLFVVNTSFANLSPIHFRLQLEALKSFSKIIFMKDIKAREMKVLKLTSNNEKVWKGLVDRWTEIAEKRPISMMNFFRQLIAAATYQVADEAPPCPVTIVCSRKDRMVHYTCSEKLGKLWHLPVVIHEDAGHDIAIDAPEWLIQTVNDSLAR